MFSDYFELSSTDPTHPAFYYKIILAYTILVISLYYVNRYLRIRKASLKINSSFSRTMTLSDPQSTLRKKYLTAYILTRAATWAKSPYLFTLYHTYHKFTVSEIGVLYIIDAVFSFLSGPIFGSMADKYGRRLFSELYNIFVITNLSLRMTGIKPLAYVAQVLTGLGSTLLTTPFESWLVYEASKVFPDKSKPKRHERFLQEIFKDQALYDSICSIVISCVTAVLFTFCGLLAPLTFAVVVSFIALCVIHFTWCENKPNAISKKSTYDSFCEACKELKKRNVLSIGVIESIFMACTNLFIFIWTPVLANTTTNGQMNVGFIFIVFVIMIIVGTFCFELCFINLEMRYYMGYFVSLVFEAFVFFSIYKVDNFTWRLVMFSCVNVVGGFFNPLNSIVKSKILVEKYRATLMNIYKIPVSVYFIVVMIFLKWIAPLKVVLIEFWLVVVCVVIIASLLVFPVKGDTVTGYDGGDDDEDEEEDNKVNNNNNNKVFGDEEGHLIVNENDDY